VDRDGIERPDFPTGRRGYDPEAVHAHLRRVADEFEALRSRAERPPAPPALSAGTSEQVRLILEAAERSAAELRAKAAEEAGAHVARVEDAAQGMLGRVDELERQLGGLLESLRRAGERLTGGLDELRAEVEAGKPEPTLAPEPPPAPAPADADPPSEPALADPPPEPSHAEPPPAPNLADPLPTAPHGELAGLSGGNGDDAGARLVALNMALSGSSREETARYLAENFAVADPEALLDDVYARVGR
jgi:DivIVA domain-containing protein